LIDDIQKGIDSGDYSTDTLDKLQEKAEEVIKELNQLSGSDTYIPNGNKVVYIDRKKADRSYPV
jgi:hypothetical protein